MKPLFPPKAFSQMTFPIIKIAILLPGHHPECFYHRCVDIMGGFNRFKMNLLQRYTFLNKNPFKMSWHDDDGDKITLCNDADWMIFMELKGKKLIVELIVIPLPDCETKTETETPIEARRVVEDKNCDVSKPIKEKEIEKLQLRSVPKTKENKFRDSWVVSPMESVPEDVAPVEKLKSRPNDLMGQLEALKSLVASGDHTDVAKVENLGKTVLNMVRGSSIATIPENDGTPELKDIGKPSPNNPATPESNDIEVNPFQPCHTRVAPVKKKPTVSNPVRWPSPNKEKRIEKRPFSSQNWSSPGAPAWPTTFNDFRWRFPAPSALSNKVKDIEKRPFITDIIHNFGRQSPTKVKDIEERSFQMGSLSSNGPTVVTPAEPKASMNYHAAATICQLLSMGFKNDDGMLTRLVQSVDGSIDRALDVLLPMKLNVF